MNNLEQRAAAKQFADYWKGKGYEKGESQPFWMSLLRNVFGVEDAEDFIKFEERVKLDQTSFIDGYIPSTHVLIEQKGLGKDLKSPIKQSDGTLLTPFQQAKRYSIELSYSQRPRWIVTCNFSTFLVYDMENPTGEPEEILLENLSKEYYRLSFLVDRDNAHIKRQTEISVKAGEIVGIMYNALLKQYINPEDENSLKSLNMLCVRLVFCLYAEDAGIFGRRNMFRDYITSFDSRYLRNALLDLFKVLNTEEDNRDPYLDLALAEFPYVNGGLFSKELIEIPQLTEDIKDLLLSETSDNFDWSQISPTIFGAVFESTLNPETRRSGGMHYTSIENIHKLIDPLFLSDLRNELNAIKEIKVRKTREKKLMEFQQKLSELSFFDPACGSGNFLTEIYLSLRRLENDILGTLLEGQIKLGDENYNPIKLSINQFYGIEINDFAVTVARTALWIAESQMLKETETIIHSKIDFLPLKSYANIIEGNALLKNWDDVVPRLEMNYIIGNPPFIGKKEQSTTQKGELLSIYGEGTKGAGIVDYVTAWYIKAAEFMQGTSIQTAFVSTNSITQGEQPPILWSKLKKLNTNIIFAYRSFNWTSESYSEASVYCVIIGFKIGIYDKKPKIYTNQRFVYADNINPYLVDAPFVIINSRTKPLCDVPEMRYGSMPIDKNNLILNEGDVNALLKEDTKNSKFIREYVGGDELLKGKKRWCIWLKDIDPSEYIKSRFIMSRIEANRNYRLSSSRSQTIKAADTPHLFGEIRQPKNGALVIPKVSSEDRRYIPISYVKPGIIINGSALMVPNASLYHFGILSSNVHNAWMRTVAGRLEMRYQYSASIVYNNFPWPKPTLFEKEQIEEAAKNMLKARENHSNVTLANMYKDSNFLLFSDLKQAHDDLNRAVMNAYRFSISDTTETGAISELMKIYQQYNNVIEE